jgi:hypothetical protein
MKFINIIFKINSEEFYCQMKENKDEKLDYPDY